MTDNEIIKVLECCYSARTVDDCEKSGCPCSADPQTCVFADNQTIQRVIDVSLGLINRLQAENDKLAKDWSDITIEKDELFDIAEKQKAEIERLNKQLEVAYKKIVEMVGDD